MSRETMQQALNAFEAIMFEKDAESCQIIAKNARYALRDELAKPEQESISTNDHLCAMLRQVHDVLACTALPMKRQWVGLTEEERNRFINYTDENFAAGVLWAEAKLKELNHAHT